MNRHQPSLFFGRWRIPDVGLACVASVIVMAGVLSPPVCAWLGKQGGVLTVVSADTGEKLSEQIIAAIPVWDGVIATGGRLYLALQDGTVVCMGE